MKITFFRKLYFIANTLHIHTHIWFWGRLTIKSLPMNPLFLNNITFCFRFGFKTPALNGDAWTRRVKPPLSIKSLEAATMTSRRRMCRRRIVGGQIWYLVVKKKQCLWMEHFLNECKHGFQLRNTGQRPCQKIHDDTISGLVPEHESQIPAHECARPNRHPWPSPCRRWRWYEGGGSIARSAGSLRRVRLGSFLLIK